jgi:hypothetical protein
MKTMIAAAVTALALSACGGPLEDDPAFAAESQQQGLEKPVVGGHTDAQLVHTGGFIATLPDVKGDVLANPMPHPENLWYVPVPGHGNCR